MSIRGSSPDTGITTDTLLLACSLRVPPGSLVIEIGCGSCGAMIAASKMNPGCSWAGVELRSEPLAGAATVISAMVPPPPVRLVRGDGSAPPFTPGIADAVLCNPPFSREGECRPSPDPLRRCGRSAPPLLLHRFIRAGSDLLRDGGELLMINRPGMLTEMLLGFMASDLVAETLQPVGMQDRPARSILLTGRRGGGSRFGLLPQRTPEDILERLQEEDA